MNIYVDCGAGDGDTLDCKTLFGFEAEAVFAFEPNPRYAKKLEMMDGVIFYPNAVWTKTEVITFAVDESESGNGSTVMPGKKSHWDSGKKIKVDAINFSNFIKTLKEKGDVILVKMDIEGAEFPVLEHMYSQGTDKLIDKLFVEMHPNKVREYTTTYSDELLAKLRCKRVYKWH